MNTKFLLDSGDPQEYRDLLELAAKYQGEIWGSTTNPSLIAKKLAGEKISQEEAFVLQKQIVMEILTLVPGAVSAEVYADQNTKAEAMIAQGLEIATWHERVVVKLPTTVEGFKARTTLRQKHIPTNNTLVFSQEQIFAICLHEQIIQTSFGPIQNKYPPFISPFVGRLDDIGISGIQLVEHGMKIKQLFTVPLWMLEASVRSSFHIKKGMDLGTELITAPFKSYQQWFDASSAKPPVVDNSKTLEQIPYWIVPSTLLSLTTVDQFMDAIESGTLNIAHELTDKGIVRFVQDWQEVVSS